MKYSIGMDSNGIRHYESDMKDESNREAVKNKTDIRIVGGGIISK